MIFLSIFTIILIFILIKYEHYEYYEIIKETLWNTAFRANRYFAFYGTYSLSVINLYRLTFLLLKAKV